MAGDLYQMSSAGAVFRRPCGGNQQEENNESCVEIAQLPGTDSVILRDSKPEGQGQGRELRFTKAEMTRFVVGYAREHGLI